MRERGDVREDRPCGDSPRSRATVRGQGLEVGPLGRSPRGRVAKGCRGVYTEEGLLAPGRWVVPSMPGARVLFFTTCRTR